MDATVAPRPEIIIIGAIIVNRFIPRLKLTSGSVGGEEEEFVSLHFILSFSHYGSKIFTRFLDGQCRRTA